jgi:hypothetical protein
MKKRKRSGIIFARKRHLGERICRWSGEFAVGVIVEHLLEVCASARSATEVAIAFTQREVSVRPARSSGIIVEILLILRGRQIVKLASKQTVGVIELTLSCSLGVMP